jgi:hypothetical protein
LMSSGYPRPDALNPGTEQTVSSERLKAGDPQNNSLVLKGDPRRWY